LSEATNEQRSAILADLVASPIDIRTIARKQGLSLAEFASLASSPDVLDCLRQLARIHDASALMAMGRARMRAIRNLGSDELTEIQRKASVDLIKNAPAPLAPDIQTDPAGASTSTLDQATQDLIRQALEAIAPLPPDDEA
jgi:hypothetical protein